MQLGEIGQTELKSTLNSQTTNPRSICLWRCDWRLPVHPCRRLPSKCSANALFLPITKADYRDSQGLSLIQNCSCWLDRAGSQERYGDDIYVVKQDFAEYQAEAATNGFAKSLRDGMVRFLALIWLVICWELIHEIVLAMCRINSKFQRQRHIYPTLAEVNSKAAFALTKQKYENHKLQPVREVLSLYGR